MTNHEDRNWTQDALDLLDRLMLQRTYISTIRHRLRPVLGWHPTKDEVEMKARRLNAFQPHPKPDAEMARTPLPKPKPGTFRVPSGGFSIGARR